MFGERILNAVKFVDARPILRRGRKTIYNRTFWLMRKSDDWWSVAILTEYLDGTAKIEYYENIRGKPSYNVQKFRYDDSEKAWKSWDEYYKEWTYIDAPVEWLHNNGYRRVHEITRGLFEKHKYEEGYE